MLRNVQRESLLWLVGFLLGTFTARRVVGAQMGHDAYADDGYDLHATRLLIVTPSATPTTPIRPVSIKEIPNNP